MKERSIEFQVEIVTELSEKQVQSDLKAAISAWFSKFQVSRGNVAGVRPKAKPKKAK